MSDQGPQYANEVFTTYCDFWKIKHRMALPYRPQANGIVERAKQGDYEESSQYCL